MFCLCPCLRRTVKHQASLIYFKKNCRDFIALTPSLYVFARGLTLIPASVVLILMNPEEAAEGEAAVTPSHQTERASVYGLRT